MSGSRVLPLRSPAKAFSGMSINSTISESNFTAKEKRGKEAMHGHFVDDLHPLIGEFLDYENKGVSKRIYVQGERDGEKRWGYSIQWGIQLRKKRKTKKIVGYAITAIHVNLSHKQAPTQEILPTSTDSLELPRLALRAGDLLGKPVLMRLHASFPKNKRII